MAFEIERRFLIKNDNWKKYIIKQSKIEQGYLNSNLNDWIIRIRSDNKSFKISLKKHIKNFTNYEFEYNVPFEDGEKIMSNVKNIIKKDRFILKINQNQWIIDCFKENNYPLIIAEIELANEDEKFNHPNFLSKEITGIKMFTNFSLANHPFTAWNGNNLKNFLKD